MYFHFNFFSEINVHLIFSLSNIYCNYRCPSHLMNKLLCSTIWFVVLKIVRRMASFTAMLATYHCVNNAETNIKKVPTPKTMKLSFTDTTNIIFPWKYAKTIQHETKSCFVENVAFPYALNAP